jgi:hypothetical protein
MRGTYRSAAAAVMLASVIGAANAVTISNASVTIDGNTYTSPGGGGEGFSYIPGPLATGDGIEFHSVNDIVVNGDAPKVITFSYDVAADAGYHLTGVEVSPGISGFDGLASVSLTHGASTNVANFAFDAITGGYADPYSYSLGGTLVHVTGSYTVLPGADLFSYVYADHVGVTYTEAVPEPASMAALAVGAIGILGRRRKK